MNYTISGIILALGEGYKAIVMKEKLSNKTEYILIDYFRLICAIGIVALHLNPFADVSDLADFFVGSILTRLCVPFFFIVAGFFLKDKLSDWEKVKRYVGHLIVMYLAYSLIYLPVKVSEFRENDKPFVKDTISYIKNFFLVGSYGQLWYFLALIFAVSVLYLLVSKLKMSERALIILSIVLYLAGTYFRVYVKPIKDVILEIRIFEIYDELFKNTRNGLFFGLPLVFAGNMYWKKREKIEKKHYAILFAVSFFALVIEGACVNIATGAHELDLLIFLPLASSMLFFLVAFAKRDVSRERLAVSMRKLSVLIFGFHMLVQHYLYKILEKLEINIKSLAFFFIVLVITTIIGLFIMWISEKKYFTWLKVLY